MRGENWSTTDEIKKKLPRSDTTNIGGPILYHEYGKNWIYPDEGHTMFLGATGTGKSRRGTIPMIRNFIDAGESFITVDPKGEIFRLTGEEVRKEFKVYVINFRNLFASDGWNPLSLAYDYYYNGTPYGKEEAQHLINDLAYSMYPISEREDPYWSTSSRSVFTGVASYLLMERVNPEDFNLGKIYQFIADTDPDIGDSDTQMKSALNLIVDEMPKNSVPARLLKNYMGTAPRTHNCIRSCFFEGLSPFIRSEGLTSLLSGDDLKISQLDGSTPTAIYIILPDETPIFDSLAGVLCDQLTEYYIKMAEEKYGGRLPRRLNICLEELGNIGSSIPNLPHLMTAGRSRNIRCQLVLQDLQQLKAIYDTARASAIESNSNVLIAYRVNSYQTLYELSGKCGEKVIKKDNYEVREPLITPTQLGSMKTGQALVMIPDEAMKFITLLPDYEDMFSYKQENYPFT